MPSPSSSPASPPGPPPPPSAKRWLGYAGCYIGAAPPRFSQTKRAPGADWCDPDLKQEIQAELYQAKLNLEAEARLGAFWLHLSEEFHQSIAGWSLRTLQLISLAAPPGLLEASEALAEQSTELARASFSAASALLKYPVGPGPVAESGPLQCDKAQLAALANLSDWFGGGELQRALELHRPPNMAPWAARIQASIKLHGKTRREFGELCLGWLGIAPLAAEAGAEGQGAPPPASPSLPPVELELLHLINPALPHATECVQRGMLPRSLFRAE